MFPFLTLIPKSPDGLDKKVARDKRRHRPQVSGSWCELKKKKVDGKLLDENK
jgi:hypothetical protein